MDFLCGPSLARPTRAHTRRPTGRRLSPTGSNGVRLFALAVGRRRVRSDGDSNDNADAAQQGDNGELKLMGQF